MKKTILLLCSFIIIPQAFALVTTSVPGKSFNQLFTRGSFYQHNNPYAPGNTAYSPTYNPYNKKSFWQNSSAYGTKVFTSQGKPAGIIWKPLGYADSKILNNTYNEVAMRQNKGQITQEYNQNRNPYPYNQFNYIYVNTSVYNNPRYATKLISNKGMPHGVIQYKTYNNHYSTFNTYGNYGNPFENNARNGFQNIPLNKR